MCLANTNPSQAVIQHFDRKTIGGGTHCPYISVGDPNFVAAANNLGLLIFDGNEWSLMDMPNGAQARSVAGFENLLAVLEEAEVGEDELVAEHLLL